MIAFGICVGPSDRFERVCQPALTALAPDCEVVALRQQRSIASAYNQILDRYVGRTDIQAVVLIHDDVELVDTTWQQTLLSALTAPDVAIVGVIGASGRGGMAWFTRQHKFGHVTEPHNSYDFERTPTAVDVLDGLFLAMSPWAIENLRFDEHRYPAFHGYDSDICAQARAQGREVLVSPIDVVHHTAGAFGSTRSYEDWIRAGLAWRLRWGQLRGTQRAIARARLTTLPIEVRVRPSVRARRRGLK
jgi:hypothetical protein